MMYAEKIRKEHIKELGFNFSFLNRIDKKIIKIPYVIWHFILLLFSPFSRLWHKHFP